MPAARRTPDGRTAENSPLLFTMPGFEGVIGAAQDVVALEPTRFANGELVLRLPEPVAARSCVLIGSVSPPEHQLVTFLLAADTLKRHGAEYVTAALPYLAYARQDRLEEQTSLAAPWLGRLLAASGVDEGLTVDIHSDVAAQLLDIPIRSLSPAALLAAFVDADAETVVVAPDHGAIDRARAFAAALGVRPGSAWLEKRRTASGVTHTSLNGLLRRHAIVVDDILDTGGTLVSCCRELRRRGVQTIDIAVTHGLFTGDGWRELLELVRGIHVTDSVPEAREQSGPSITVHPIAPLLVAACTDLRRR